MIKLIFAAFIVAMLCGCATGPRPTLDPYIGQTGAHSVAYETRWGIADGASVKQLPGQTITIVRWDSWHDGRAKTVTLINDKVVDITVY